MTTDTPTPLAPTLAEMLGTDDAVQQAQQVQELLVRVHHPPIIVSFAFDPVTNSAEIISTSAPLNHDGLQLALASATQAVVRSRINHAQQQAEEQATQSEKTKRGKAGKGATK